MEQNKNMVIDVKLSIVDFVSTVNDIVLEYFDADGAYTPHIGLLNAMRVFYNECVKESKFDGDIPHNVADALEMEAIVADEQFIQCFNEALKTDEYSLTFATAYNEAMKIVEQKKTSVFGAVELIKKVIMQVVDNMNGALTPENIQKITALFSKMNGSNIDMGTLMKLFGQANENVGVTAL